MAGILKRSSSVGGLLSHPMEAQPFTFADIDQTRAAILRQARDEADALLDDARREAAAIRCGAAELGRETALRQAREETRAELTEQLDACLPVIRQAAASLQAMEDQWKNQWTVSLIALAVRIAEKIVRRQLSLSPNITVTLVREALAVATSCEGLRLRLHPLDAELLAAEAPALLTELSRLGPAEIVADPALSRGSCLLDTRHGQIDQRIETQLKRIEAELCGTC